MECSEFDAHPGDIIYMPKGLPHVAKASETGLSVHLTLGFKRDHMRWVDLAADTIRYQVLSEPSSAVAGDVVDMVDGLVRKAALTLPIWMFDAVPLGQAQQAQGAACLSLMHMVSHVLLLMQPPTVSCTIGLLIQCHLLPFSQLPSGPCLRRLLVHCTRLF